MHFGAEYNRKTGEAPRDRLKKKQLHIHDICHFFLMISNWSLLHSEAQSLAFFLHIFLHEYFCVPERIKHSFVIFSPRTKLWAKFVST